MYRVMLADDEGIVIDSTKFIIEKEFGNMCQVEFAKSGRKMIELAETFRPDIAIVDIHDSPSTGHFSAFTGEVELHTYPIFCHRIKVCSRSMHLFQNVSHCNKT